MRGTRRLAGLNVKRAATWLAVMAAATGASMAVTAAPSFAWPATVKATSSAGYGYFNGDVQILAIHDSHKDGYGVAIMYYRYDLAHTGPYYAWNRDGNGTTTYLYLNMPSGTEIKIYACPEKGGMIINYECGERVFANVPI